MARLPRIQGRKVQDAGRTACGLRRSLLRPALVSLMGLLGAGSLAAIRTTPGTEGHPPEDRPATAEARALADHSERRLRRGQDLEAKLFLERASIDPSDIGALERAERASRNVRKIRIGVAALMARRHPRVDRLEELVHSISLTLHRRGVRLQRDGGNALFVEIFDEPRPHPGSLGATLEPAYWIDCDGAVILIRAILEEYARRVRIDLDRVAVLSASDHMALVLHDPEGVARVLELRPANWSPGEPPGMRLLPFETYRLAYLARGEEPRLLKGWGELLTNTWEVSAARLLSRGLPEKALAWAEEAGRQAPESVHPRLTAALALRDLGRFDQAAERLQSLVSRGVKSAKLYLALASVEMAAGRAHSALRAADEAISLRPELPLAYHRRAEILRAMGDEAGASVDAATFRSLTGASAVGDRD